MQYFTIKLWINRQLMLIFEQIYCIILQSVKKGLILLKKPRREIADFYKKIFSNAIFKNKIQEKAKKVVTKKDLRKLIREEIMPLMKKENLNYSEEDLLKYEEETLKSLSKEDLANVSGGISVNSALWAGGILSMALFGSLNANAMEVDPFASTPQQTRRSSQQQNNSNNNNGNANQPGNNGNNNHNAANNNDRASAWRNRLYGLLNNLPPDVQRWATSLSLIEKGLIVSDGNYLFFRDENGSVSPLLSPGVTILAVSPTVWDINGTRYTVNRISRLNGPGEDELSEIEEIITYAEIKNLTIAPQCFADNKKLRRVELKNVYNLTIEKSAFSGCEGLSEFALNNFAKVSIYENAFVGCRSLAKFILSEDPKNVSIKEDAFVGCKSLNKTPLIEKYGYVETSVNINNDTGAANKPASQDSNNGNNVATSNKDNSKDGSNNAANSALPQNRNESVSNRNNNNFSPIDKNAYSENATFRYFEGRLSNDVKNSEKFRKAMKTGCLLESGEFLLSFDPDLDLNRICLYVPDDVSEITINAEALNIIFGNKHTFPNYRLEEIYGGKNLKKIKLGSDIENFVFFCHCCEDLKALLEEVDASGAHNVIICSGAFSSCKNLKKFIGAENTEIIGLAFFNCTSLCDVILPADTRIADDAFKGCTSLKRILLLEKNSNNVHTANINNDNGTTNNPAPQNRNVNNFSPIDKNAYSKNATFCKFESRLSDDVKNSEKFRNAMETGLLLDAGEFLLSFELYPNSLSVFAHIYLFVPDEVSEITINAEAWNIIFGNKHTFLNYGLGGIYGGKNLKKIKLGHSIENFEFDMSCCEKREVLEEVDASGARNVTICAYAFSKCKNLKKFIGAKSNVIYGAAFSDCTSLCEVRLPGCADARTDAFEGCTSLKGILPLEKNSNNNVHTANINNDNGAENNPAPQDSDNGNNKHPKQFSRPYISASTVLLEYPAPQNTNSNGPDNDNNKDSSNVDLFASAKVAHDIITGSLDYNENIENKNDASDQHNDNSNNNESVDEYNDEDYSVDIDEIMASQIRAFGKNPEMMTLDRNAAIKIANNNDAANNATPQDSNNGSSDHNKNIENKNDDANNPAPQDSNNESSGHNENIENKNDAASNASPQDSNNGSSDHNENTKNKNNDPVPYIQKNANGKIIFVIPIWCDVIKGWAFDYSANIANPEEQARFKKMIESVEILVVPPNVKEIGIRALQGWPNLKKIIFIDGWPQLDGGSFADCSQLKKVESIGDSSNRPDVSSSKSRIPFTRCNNLEEIDIADNVVYTTSLIVDTDNHEYGKKLKKISMPKRAEIIFCGSYIIGGSPHFISIEELYFPIESSCKSFKISNWTKLEELDVPFVFNGLTPSKEVPPWDNLSVENCNSLKKINIRGDVRAINAGRTLDESAGYYRYNNVVYIWNCLKLEEVTLPPSLEYVGGNFDNLIWGECPNLKKITFLSEKIYFGEKSFSPQAFPDLKPEYSEDFFNSENFPDGCKICLPYAKEIYVDGKKYDIPNDNPDNAIEIVKINYNERDNYDEDVRIGGRFVFQKVLDKKDAELILNGSIPGWDAKNRVISRIPKYYCKVGEKAFKDNGSIEYVGIPVSVKEIANEAFANCANLEVFASKYIPKFGNKAFDGCTKLEKVAACSEGGSKKIMAEQNLAEVFSNCPNFKGIELFPEHDYVNDIAFLTIDQVKSWDSKNFGGIIISNENVYFEKGFFSSEYFPEGFKIYLLDPKEICVDCEKIPITKEEDNSSKDNHDEEDSDYEDNFQYNVGEKIPLPENINSSGVVSEEEEEEEEEEALEKGIILIKTNPEKEKGLNPTSNPILKYGWRIESYSD